ncbi:LysR substrate-binding domain-containing protein [Hydrogenophaga sp. MI9]|uniref:LysR substrate-binding domain-containing protein n=1 Tax=Hydrogenophaga sp. MI9 TaxID=3453719 RepID=UPI003EEA5B33
MNLTESLRVFVRVADLASFSAAADQLGLPRTSVSAAVREAEAELGTRLLHRTTRRVQLTQDGRVVHERAQDLLADIDELRGLFQDEPRSLRGRLRVDMPQTLAHELVIPALPRFLAEHPALEIELSSVDRRVDLVREGFDCVLRVGRLADSSLVARPLGSYRMVNLASPAYLKAHGKPRTLADLASHRLVHYVSTLGSRPEGFEHVDADGAVHALPMQGALTVNTTAAYEAAALAGLGIIQVPEAGMRAHLQARRLVEVLPRWRAAPLPVSIVYAHRRHLPQRVQVFMQWLAALVTPRLQA